MPALILCRFCGVNFASLSSYFMHRAEHAQRRHERAMRGHDGAGERMNACPIPCAIENFAEEDGAPCPAHALRAGWGRACYDAANETGRWHYEIQQELAAEVEAGYYRDALLR